MTIGCESTTSFKGIEFLPQTKFSDSYFFETWWCKPLIFDILGLSEFIVWNIKIYDIGLHRYMDYNFEFVAKTHFLSGYNLSYPWRHSVLKMGYLRGYFLVFPKFLEIFKFSSEKGGGVLTFPLGLLGNEQCPPPHWKLKTMMNGIPYFLCSFVNVPL